MGCGCGGGGAAQEKVTKYKIVDDPHNKLYLTEHQARAAKSNRQLSGEVVPVTS